MNKFTTCHKDPATKTSWRRNGDVVQMYWPQNDDDLQVRWNGERYEARSMIRGGINEWVPWLVVETNEIELAGTRAHKVLLNDVENTTPSKTVLSSPVVQSKWYDAKWEPWDRQTIASDHTPPKLVRRTSHGNLLWQPSAPRKNYWRRVDNVDSEALLAIWDRVMAEPVLNDALIRPDECWEKIADTVCMVSTKASPRVLVRKNKAGSLLWIQGFGGRWRKLPTDSVGQVVAAAWAQVMESPKTETSTQVDGRWEKTAAGWVEDVKASSAAKISPFVASSWTDSDGQVWHRGPNITIGEVSITSPVRQVFKIDDHGDVFMRYPSVRSGWTPVDKTWVDKVWNAVDSMYDYAAARKLCRSICVMNDFEVEEARDEFLARITHLTTAEAHQMFAAALRYVGSGEHAPLPPLPSECPTPTTIPGNDGQSQDALDNFLDTIVALHRDESTSTRTAASFLDAALGHMKDRATTYDKPQGERSMGNCVAAFNLITGHQLAEEQGWLFMAVLKIVRTQQGNFRADNYEDLAAYAGLAGETAAKSRT